MYESDPPWWRRIPRPGDAIRDPSQIRPVAQDATAVALRRPPSPGDYIRSGSISAAPESVVMAGLREHLPGVAGAVDAARRSLRPKPGPNPFTTAASLLGLDGSDPSGGLGIIDGPARGVGLLADVVPMAAKKVAPKATAGLRARLNEVEMAAGRGERPYSEVLSALAGDAEWRSLRAQLGLSTPGGGEVGQIVSRELDPLHNRVEGLGPEGLGKEVVSPAPPTQKVRDLSVGRVQDAARSVSEQDRLRAGGEIAVKGTDLREGGFLGTRAHSDAPGQGSATMMTRDLGDVNAGVWYTGQQAPDLRSAAARKGSLYLTRDPEFAQLYGTVHRFPIEDPGRVLDTANPVEVERVVDELFRDWDAGKLDSELREMLETAEAQAGDVEGARDLLTKALSPEGIRGESVYDNAALQQWLWDRHEFDLVRFGDDDTALALNPLRYLQPGGAHTPHR